MSGRLRDVKPWQQLGLSPRENACAAMATEGLTNKEIAARLGITGATVATHLHNAMVKFGVTTRTELAVKLRGPAEPFALEAALAEIEYCRDRLKDLALIEHHLERLEKALIARRLR